jgi:3-isopropylmalate dehydrogenase
MLVVREGQRAVRRRGRGPAPRHADEVATEESLNTAYGVERVVRDAFGRAQQRPRRKLTLVHKNNVLVRSGDLWTRMLAQVGAEFPDVQTDYLHVDAATMFFVTHPSASTWWSPTTCSATSSPTSVRRSRRDRARCERQPGPDGDQPVHVRAGARLGAGHRRHRRRRPDRDSLSVAMLLQNLGLGDAAARVETAVAADLAARGDSRAAPPRSGTLSRAGSPMTGPILGYRAA